MELPTAERKNDTFMHWKDTKGNIYPGGTEISNFEVGYSAIFTPDFYLSVTFVTPEGSIIDEQKIAYGDAASAPDFSLPRDKGFLAWDKDFSNVTSDMTVTMITEDIEARYLVLFIDSEGNPIITKNYPQWVVEGKDAIAPIPPVKEGYTFIEWDNDFSAVRADIIVTAMYEKNAVLSLDSTLVKESGFNFYPNPASDILHVTSGENRLLEIYNTIGQLIKEVQIDDAKTELDLSAFKSGLYFLFDKERKTMNKLVISRK